MTCNIEEMPPSPIVYIRRIGPYGIENYALMENFKQWVKDNGLFKKSAIILGISHDNPEITPPKSCRYDIGIVVDEDFALNDKRLSKAVLPGGRYAVFTIPHTAEAVQKAWSDIFSLLSAQNQQPDISRPILERYIPSMIDKHLCEICVPV